MKFKVPGLTTHYKDMLDKLHKAITTKKLKKLPLSDFVSKQPACHEHCVGIISKEKVGSSVTASLQPWPVTIWLSFVSDASKSSKRMIPLQCRHYDRSYHMVKWATKIIFGGRYSLFLQAVGCLTECQHSVFQWPQVHVCFLTIASLNSITPADVNLRCLLHVIKPLGCISFEYALYIDLNP